MHWVRRPFKGTVTASTTDHGDGNGAMVGNR